MKKKLLLSLLIVLALFVITGCGKSDSKGSSSDNLHKLEFVDMRYNEPKNYSKKEPIEDDNKSIGLYYYKNTSLANVDSEYEEVTINGITWKKYHATDMGVYDTYDYIYNNGLYRIELNAVDKYADEFNEFMKDVSFE